MNFVQRIVSKRKPSIKAIQYNVENLNEVIEFVGIDNISYCPLSQELWIKTHTGESKVHNGYYVVKKQGVGCYPIAERYFHKIYIEKQTDDK